MSGITVKKAVYGPTTYRDRTYTDEEILELFPDGDGSFVNPLLRRAQKAEAEVDRLRNANERTLAKVDGVDCQTGHFRDNTDPDELRDIILGLAVEVERLNETVSALVEKCARYRKVMEEDDDE